MDSDYTIVVIIIVMLYLAFVKYICINKDLMRKLFTKNHIPTKNNTNIINNKGRKSDVISPIHDNDNDDNDNDAKSSLSTIEF